MPSADALGADGCMVLVEESSHVDVRYALNTTTTNGEQRGRSVSVIALRRQVLRVRPAHR